MVPEKVQGPLSNPWPWVIGGFGAVFLGWAAGALAVTAAAFPVTWSIPLVVAGAIAVGGGVAIRPQSPAVLGAAAVVAFVAAKAFGNAGWDSAELLLMVMTGVAAAAAGIVCLGTTGRRVVASLIILFHFGGILTAVTSPQPGPWLSNYLWTNLYRPYLQFMYTNNAYHFYAPEPGPAPMLWFLVEYQSDADGKNWRWVKIPDFDRERHGIPVRPDHRRLWPKVEYTRRLSIAQSADMIVPNRPPNFAELWQRRVLAGDIKDIPTVPENIMLPTAQYNEPADISKLWLESYARFVCRTYKHERKPELPVKGVKIYRVVHQLILPAQLVEGVDPWDETQYYPFFFGEYDPEGHLLSLGKPEPDGSPGTEGRDPFLYFLLPFVKGPNDTAIKNSVLRHAEIPDKGEIP